ncbi:Translation initiation factor eIF-2B subunit epsilon [Euphorbia peplus]|nr:Translation initiation factor eIF-2B subunit epsilon [Euphorbia peplus]
MGAQRKAGARVADEPETLARNPLQAILLADSFTTKFRPITLERPKVLLPLVNVPMIDYTLAWLESAGVEEVFVFCCAHSHQVIEYLENSKWLSSPNFIVTTIESHNSISAGDALRLIYERNVIHGDFVLVSGDTVSNMSLTEAILEHKERRKKDNNAVMTMVIKRSKPSPIIHQSRLGTDELFLAVDPETKQLLYYEDRAEHLKGVIPLDNMLLADNPRISLHNDSEDCYIDICSPEVLSLFTDNFDYQHLRRHFLKGLLVDDIMGYKIFTYEIRSSYAARIDNYRSYDTISKDIIHRWTYPFVPDVLGDPATKLGREGIYRASEIEQSCSALVGPFTVVGKGTRIGNNSKISNSVIGKGCAIGSNVSIIGSYLWDDVTIEDGCELRHAIICDGVIIKSGAVLQPGIVLSFKVVIGPQCVVPAYSKASLLQQPTIQDSDEELEYADNNSGMVDSCNVDSLNGEMSSEPSGMQQWPASELGTGGAGYVWSISEGGHEDEWKHSVAPIPAERLAQALQAIEDDLELLNLDGNALSLSGELKADSDSNVSDDDDDSRDDTFEKEVEATFLRAVDENIKVGDVILEMNSLRLSFNMTSADCAGAIFYAMMKLAMENAHTDIGELFKNVTDILTKWGELLKFYSKEIDDQIEVILKFEEMCLECAKKFSQIFAEILKLYYDNDIIEEDAILRWADEKKDADESDKVFVKKSEAFIQWLKEAPEEEEEEDD